MFNSLNNNKGFLLVTSYMVMSALLILGAVFYARSVSENNFARTYLYSLIAKYQAERGFECAYYEIKRYGERYDRVESKKFWLTHYMWPSGILTVVGDREPDFVSITANEMEASIYVPTNQTNGSFQVKTYADPDEPGVVVVLTKGIGPDGSIQRLFVSKVSARNLYNYFVFTPDDLWMNRHYWDAKGGRIQVNGNVIFGDYATATGIGQLNTAKDFAYYVKPYVDTTAGGPNAGCNSLSGPCEKYYLRPPWYIPNNADKSALSYLNQPDGHLSGDRFGAYKTVAGFVSPNLPWELINKNPANNNPPLPAENSSSTEYPGIYRCQDGINCDPVAGKPYYQAHATINEKTIPNRLIGSTYWWNKYQDLTAAGATAGTQLNSNYIKVDYTYTGLTDQQTAWNNYISAPAISLTNVLKKGVTPLRRTVPPITKYKNAAKTKGIYVFVGGVSAEDTGLGCTNGKLCARVNGTTYVESSGVIQVNGTTIMQKRSFVNTRSTRTNPVVEVNVAAFQNIPPQNGILYVKYNGVVLNNAKKLPDTGLTTVSEGNLILKGEYNLEGWSSSNPTPSAAIVAQKIYTVSEDFNYPQTLPATLHNINFPYPVTETYPYYTPDPANYYATNQANMPNAVITTGLTSDPVTGKPVIRYNVSLNGPYADQPEVLERWSYPDTATTQVVRSIIGAKVKLKPADFRGYNSILDENTKRAGRNAAYPGWPNDMTAVLGNPLDLSKPNDKSEYDSRYLPNSGNSARPPGFTYDNTEFIWMELPATEANFNYGCNIIRYQ